MGKTWNFLQVKAACNRDCGITSAQPAAHCILPTTSGASPLYMPSCVNAAEYLSSAQHSSACTWGLHTKPLTGWPLIAWGGVGVGVSVLVWGCVGVCLSRHDGSALASSALRRSSAGQ